MRECFYKLLIQKYIQIMFYKWVLVNKNIKGVYMQTEITKTGKKNPKETLSLGCLYVQSVQ